MKKNIYLTPHFTLEEMTHTNVLLGGMDRQRQTQPEEQVMDNLTRVCQWLGKEQLLRYVTLLLDISDEMHQDFDELLLERNARGYWLHFAVRPKDNRRKIQLINVI